MPRQLGAEKLVHGAEVDGCLLLVVFVQGRFSGEEEDAGHRGRNRAQEGLAGEGCNGLRTGLRATQAVLHHVWLQHCTFQVDVVISEGLELSSQYLLRHLGAVVDVVIAIGDDLRLHDGHQLLTLADGRIAGQGVHGVGDGEVGRQPLLRVQLQHVSPLCKTSSFCIGLLTPLLKIIKANGRNLRMPQWADLGPPNALLVVGLVHLDTRDHAVLRNDIHHGLARGIILKKGLPMEDHPADVLVEAGGGEAHRSIGRAVLQGVRNLRSFGMARAKPRPCRLVRCQESLTRRAQLRCRLLELRQHVGGKHTWEASVRQGRHDGSSCVCCSWPLPC
mmetsp:Transcript_7415/g.17036  ORF Transcript_7415/g.17036 Transcript_7415/m.17036 type:complete len:333 (+) Transcript_7415:291-1289(+)